MFNLILLHVFCVLFLEKSISIVHKGEEKQGIYLVEIICSYFA